jgi:Fe-S-cluster containining protein
VIITFDPKERAAARIAEDGDKMPDWARHQYQFFLDNWTSTSTFTAADGDTVHRVRCDQFNPDTRQCEAHDDRPRVCSEFPWYGRSPHDPDSRGIADSLSPRCSYHADVRTMLPIVEVRS